MRLHPPLVEALLGMSGFCVGLGLLTHASELMGTALAPSAAPAASNISDLQTSHRPEAIASYDLQVTLNAEQHSLAGHGTIRFKNASSAPATELYLHLYLNAFKNSQTLFQRSPFWGARSGRRAPKPGYIDVEKLVAVEQGNVDLWPSAERHSPGDPNDETDIRVPLPQPLAAGDTLTLQVQWQAQLPQISERTGYENDFHLVAQWFPKLARLEPDGRWAHFAFHPHAEFYADYGDYQVRLDVPVSHVVGATGELVAEHSGGDRKQLLYRALGVHDFAWTSWPRFLEHTETIEGIAVRLLYPQEVASLKNRELAALRFGIPHFNRAYGRYPYPTLTVVHPPANAAAAGGMEYPTLITTGSTALHNLVTRHVELLTLHELGHQWFYGLVANNEAAHPFLDEGLNSYAESVATDALFGFSSAGKLWDLELSSAALQRAHAASRQHDAPVTASAAEFANFESLGALVYARGATIVQTLARVYGGDAMQTALAEYTRAHRFAHPTPQAFVEQMTTSLGDEAGRALSTLLFDRGWVDYSIDEIRGSALPPPLGVFETEQGRVTHDDEPLAARDEWIGEVLVRRHGTAILPVDIVLVSQDGSRTFHQWRGTEPWFRLQYRGHSPLQYAMVDPDLKISIDSNLLNNCKSLEPSSTARSFERLLYAAQFLFGAVNL